jgi:hypothetical protein
MSSVLAIVQLIAGVYSALAPLVQQAIDAHQTNDQAALDAILAKAQAASDALAPDGAR